MDPNNPVVKLCVQGMECEGKGNHDEAAKLYMSAWAQSTDDFERCIAAHYVARHQCTPHEALLWNQRSLDHADAAGNDRVAEFYPSLYLNMGKAYEDVAQYDEARCFYEMAQGALDPLPDGRYGSTVRDAVRRALLRLPVPNPPLQ